MSIRRATHAGSWYSDSPTKLNDEMDTWLSKADLTHGPARAVITPHAGYSYCGACGAHGFRQISPAVVQRIFILGPSHHVRLNSCALSTAVAYQTPFYNLTIDQQVNDHLMKTKKFTTMSLDVDEAEHSIEMQCPYIAKVMEDYRSFTIVPIMVGSIGPQQEAVYGSILAPYLQDPTNLFVISSDFCHWGQRFNYTFYDKACGPIHKSIEKLDKQGMEIIENLNPENFTQYLKDYGNTICGRHPIGVLLQMIQHAVNDYEKPNFKFLQYAQSSKCRTAGDSSVSYAAGALVLE